MCVPLRLFINGNFLAVSLKLSALHYSAQSTFPVRRERACMPAHLCLSKPTLGLLAGFPGSRMQDP